MAHRNFLCLFKKLSSRTSASVALALLMPIFFSSLPSASSSLKTYSGNAYEFTITDFLKDGQSAQRFLVRKSGKILADQSAYNFALVEPTDAQPNMGCKDTRLPLHDLTGDGIQDIIVRIWSGGAHGTYTYDIYSLDGSLKKLWHFNAGDGHMLTMPKSPPGWLPVIVIEDDTFRYWRTGAFAMPAVPMRWSSARHKFCPELSLMHHKLDAVKHAQKSHRVLSELNDGRPQTIYEYIISLYYSGNGSAARDLMRQGKFTGESFEAFHTAFLKQLASSPFYSSVRSVNDKIL